MAHKDRRRIDVLGLLGFFTVVALCLLVSFEAGLRAFGAWMILTALLQQFTGRLPMGWKGAPPSARTMAWLNLLVGLFGLAILIWPDVVLRFFYLFGSN